jgi:hypothetical protein
VSDCLIGREGARTPGGYWQVYPKTHDGYTRLHRYVYAKHYGIKLTSKDLVRHVCGNPSCIEITHLTLGTHKDNHWDSIEEGRYSRQKLYPGQVGEIERKYKEGNITMKDLGTEYGVTAANIEKIVNGKTWGV